ncbi:MAG: [protein-PII] uridylyltransferase [Candidatus Desulfofervidaceae bacterium]|nr:[protein-PII] uridylyltransferase [Candidatus Desulfofervidaceae bacterium]
MGKLKNKMIDLVKERERLIKAHLAGASGKEIVLKYTNLVDNFVKELWESLAPAEVTNEVALVAIGGYGRQEMSFYSDVDLLLLHVEKPSALLQETIVSFIQSFWDYKLKLDHSFRTIEECLQVAKGNFSAFMSMLTPRFLTGNRSLFNLFVQTLNIKIVAPRREEVLREIWKEREERHVQYSSHTYLLEPNIKEGVGGLRDIHNLKWAAIVAFGHEGLHFLWVSGLLSSEEKECLEETMEFLWQVRNHLHYLSGREDDKLSFAYQEKIARFLGFKDTPSIKAVEDFMRTFFSHTFSIKHITRLFFNRLLEENRKKYFSPYRVQPLTQGVYFHNGQIRVVDEEVFLRQPALLVQVYTWAVRLGAILSSDTQHLLHRAVTDLKTPLCNDLNVRDAFLEFLTTQGDLLPFLEDMTYQGLLCNIFPEWQKVCHLPQHNVYHVYTVDLHAFHTVEEVKRLKQGKYKNKYPIFTEVAKAIDKIEILLLAALFHDLGKGIGCPHEETGAQAAEQILKRWQFPTEDKETIVWLVRHHLLLSHIAQRRDLEEEKIIIDTAQEIGDVERLQMLYVLSFADAKATGPRAFTEWKMALITDLFLKLQRLLEKGEFSQADIWDKLHRAREALVIKLREFFPDKEIYRYLDILSPRYLLNTPIEEIVFHLDLIRTLNVKPVVLHWEKSFPTNHYKVTIATWDTPGLFAKIAGSFSLNGFNILNAQAHTWRNKIALDTLWVNTKGENYQIDRKKQKVEKDLCRAIKGEIDLEKLLAVKYRPGIFTRRDLPPVSTEIKIDNESSDFYTIIEIYTADKPILLFKLAQCLFKLGLNIHLAKVSTRLDQVVDVFYVEEKKGGKIDTPERLKEIKKALEKTILETNSRCS